MKIKLPRCKTFLLTLFFLASVIDFSNSQTNRKSDIIKMRDNTRLEVVIQEVDENVVKYKKVTDLDGPLFTVRKTEIASINYGNGETETFESVGEVFFEQGAHKPLYSQSQPVARNKFEETIFGQNPNQLRQSYQYFKSKSKRGLISGIIWTSLGVISMGVGSGLLINSGYTTNSSGYTTYSNTAGTGAALFLGGFIGGATFGTIGFVKGGRNGSRATRIRRELIRRGEPLIVRLAPGYNHENWGGYVSLKVSF